MPSHSDPDLTGFDSIYEDIGLFRSHRDWIESQDALRGLPGPVLDVLAGYREGLGKGKLLEWLEPQPHQAILDNGCGVGYFIFDMLTRHGELGLRFAGTELSLSGLRLLNERKRIESRPEVLGSCADVRAIPFRDGAFDAVVCSEVLDHTPEPDRAIREMARVLSRGGKLLMTVPNGKAERLWDGLRDVGRKLLRRPPADELYYETFLDIGNVRRWIREAGLVIRHEELNTALPLGTIVRRCPKSVQLPVARALVRLEPLFRFERFATNYVVCAEKR